jgi:hypothetical protein
MTELRNSLTCEMDERDMLTLLHRFNAHIDKMNALLLIRS